MTKQPTQQALFDTPAQKLTPKPVTIDAKPAKQKAAPAKRVAPKPSTAVAKVEKPAPLAPAAVAGPVNMLAVIANAAADPRVDVEKMRALLDMQKQIVHEESRVAAIEAFSSMQNKLPQIRADGKIEIPAKGGGKAQKTPYATYANICKVVKPVLAEHGFTLWDEPDMTDEGKIVMVVHLDHVRGDQRSCRIALPMEASGSKNNVQGIGSSLSYARRYGAVMLLNLTTKAPEDKDDDGAAAGGTVVPVINAEQITKLKAAIKGCGVAEAKFCEHYAIDKVEELPAHQFDEAMKACARRAEAQAKPKESANG